jgi:hypothetical protein
LQGSLLELTAPLRSEFFSRFPLSARANLALIRHLLDQIPEHKVPEAPLEFAPLAHPPLREQFGTPLQPIAGAP